jgi:hypothetical protein
LREIIRSFLNHPRVVPNAKLRDAALVIQASLVQVKEVFQTNLVDPGIVLAAILSRRDKIGAILLNGNSMKVALLPDRRLVAEFAGGRGMIAPKLRGPWMLVVEIGPGCEVALILSSQCSLTYGQKETKKPHQN